jgi:glycosyltransferase involved in cell wall biosynthesis
VNDAELRDLYALCRGFVLPGEEDFGMAAVEALASGKPVIALARGGALETVPLESPCGGVLFPQPTETALEQALVEFESIETRVAPSELQHWAAKFSESNFRQGMEQILKQ